MQFRSSLFSFFSVLVLAATCRAAVVGLEDPALIRTATVYLAPDPNATSRVNGTITFTQKKSDQSVSVTGAIVGLAGNTLHGFHVHQYGNITGGCTSAGPHFNPYNVTHGAPTDPKTKRHVGDLGNVESDANGVAKINFTDDIIALFGEDSILARALVVHVGTDDLGKGGNADSLITGNAGARAACGVIGIAANPTPIPA